MPFLSFFHQSQTISPYYHLLISSWNVKSVASRLLASLTQRIFRARRTSGESECANRVSSLAIHLEFPDLREVMIEGLKRNGNDNDDDDENCGNHTQLITKRCVFAVGFERIVFLY